MMDIEPRKKYALVHEQIGILIIGKKKKKCLILVFFIK